jgi:hypothetical protein
MNSLYTHALNFFLSMHSAQQQSAFQCDNLQTAQAILGMVDALAGCKLFVCTPKGHSQQWPPYPTVYVPYEA